MVEGRLQADRDAAAKQRDELRQERGQRRQDRQLDEFTRKAGLNDAQKERLARISTDFRERLGALRTQVRDQVRQKALTPEQAKASLQQAFDALDAQVQPVLTPEQFKQYQEMQQPMRERTLTRAAADDPGRDRRRGRDRESPTP